MRYKQFRSLIEKLLPLNIHHEQWNKLFEILHDTLTDPPGAVRVKIAVCVYADGRAIAATACKDRPIEDALSYVGNVQAAPLTPPCVVDVFLPKIVPVKRSPNAVTPQRQR